jgi:hypothetical protein
MTTLLSALVVLASRSSVKLNSKGPTAQWLHQSSGYYARVHRAIEEDKFSIKQSLNSMNQW